MAVKTIDGCQAAGVSTVVNGKVRTRLSTNDLPHVFDGIQSETHQRPCVDAIKEHDVFVSGSLPDEDRWPGSAPRAHAETGVASVLALRLYAGEDTTGVLTSTAVRRTRSTPTTSQSAPSPRHTPPSRRQRPRTGRSACSGGRRSG